MHFMSFALSSSKAPLVLGYLGISKPYPPMILQVRRILTLIALTDIGILPEIPGLSRVVKPGGMSEKLLGPLSD